MRRPSLPLSLSSPLSLRAGLGLSCLVGLLAARPPARAAEPEAPASPPAATSTGHGPGHGPAEHGAGHGAGGHHGPLVHRFTDAARWAKEFDDPARDAWQKPQEIVARMQLKPGMTVVDLGAGTGYLLPHLAKAVSPGGQVLALDVEEDMVKYLTERAQREGLAGVKAQKVPLDDPQLAAGSADRIVILDVWHHVPERAAYAKKLAAGLKPGGAIYIVDFTKESSHGPPKRHRLTPEQVQGELRAAGLGAEKITETLPDHYIVVGRRTDAAPRP
ncbi:MAG: class I SAM-dependent methyltransferase [Polyangia bacterium]